MKLTTEHLSRITFLTHEYMKLVLTVLNLVLQFFVKNIWGQQN